jgi:DNA-binding MarR family transcriptional regulator
MNETDPIRDYLHDPSATVLGMAVLAVLTQRCDHHGQCAESVSKIAAGLQLQRGTVAKHLGTLEAANIISRTGRMRGSCVEYVLAAR